MAELGGYTGYSAVRFANKQREAAGNKPSHYHSFEFSQVFAARMREMVELAGLGDQVTVHVGPFSEQYGVLLGKTVDVSSASSSCYGAENSAFSNARWALLLLLLLLLLLQMYFIDHDKKAYLPDLKLILGSETLAPGSIVVADNVGLGPISGGKNEYIEFIESSPQFSEVRHTVYMKREDIMAPDLSVAIFLG